ncbi:RNase adapter RapZ [Ectothiorhodospira lacustris]|uniref:RNase adapter RapZ n=1 Tax=Ectothiorhodospira lacustris TaxID=2899127 RepID=UPI001EE78BDE|nr:RNase adapter RapZ [Ectothiorhodospira lacustris]MCG5500681.1 RNase adapter RapZ [Ectothiorhodospira lacustris]MCG5509933.1 RNase adapter RapZ [Ectothiorhodospira lacustris]MCG5521187.1 RNase adapter RapZ [Ectothiorhodospira lacustris]
MKLVIVSGLSGSGKTVALHALEDAGYYCIDNLHLELLPAVVSQLRQSPQAGYGEAAVGIDARSGIESLDQFGRIVNEIRAMGVELQIIFLYAELETLLRRFSETRRRHPLARRGIPLMEAINLERNLLGVIADHADLAIDTTRTNVHQLSQSIRERVRQAGLRGLSLLIQSFGFKYGSPVDSDFVFDVRCLPNPHWQPGLSAFTGKDPAVIRFLENEPMVAAMFDSLRDFLTTWIPQFENDNRSYLTVSIGCTGGRHRSVYLTERLSRHFREIRGDGVSTRHRELS